MNTFSVFAFGVAVLVLVSARVELCEGRDLFEPSSLLYEAGSKFSFEMNQRLQAIGRGLQQVASSPLQRRRLGEGSESCSRKCAYNAEERTCGPHADEKAVYLNETRPGTETVKKAYKLFEDCKYKKEAQCTGFCQYYPRDIDEPTVDDGVCSASLAGLVSVVLDSGFNFTGCSDLRGLYTSYFKCSAHDNAEGCKKEGEDACFWAKSHPSSCTPLCDKSPASTVKMLISSPFMAKSSEYLPAYHRCKSAEQHPCTTLGYCMPNPEYTPPTASADPTTTTTPAIPVADTSVPQCVLNRTALGLDDLHKPFEQCPLKTYEECQASEDDYCQVQDVLKLCMINSNKLIDIAFGLECPETQRLHMFMTDLAVCETEYNDDKEGCLSNPICEIIPNEKKCPTHGPTMCEANGPLAAKRLMGDDAHANLMGLVDALDDCAADVDGTEESCLARCTASPTPVVEVVEAVVNTTSAAFPSSGKVGAIALATLTFLAF